GRGGAHEPGIGFALRHVLGAGNRQRRDLRGADVVVHRERLERGERPDHRVHAVALDQLLHLGARLRRHAARVGDGQLDLAAAERVLVLVEEDGQAALHVDAARGERAGLDGQEADADRLGLRFQCCGETQCRGASRLDEGPAVECHGVLLRAMLASAHGKMRGGTMRKLAALCIAAFAPLASAADVEAGKATATAVCAACHGANGVSVSDTIPNLAAQRAGYIEAQLKAFKDGHRRASGPTSPTATMAAIASQLSPEDMANVAAYFSSLPGADKGTKSAFLPNVAKTQVTFPEGYKSSFVKYHTINFPATGQVRYYYANKAAV